MSALKDRLRADLTSAMKARDDVRSSTLRMVLTSVSNAEVAGKEAVELSDDEVMAVLISEAKKRREAAEAFAAADRPQQAEKERAEADVIATYLPQQMSTAEIAEMVAAAIEETGAAKDGLRAMGRVMGLLASRTRGRADGAVVAMQVRQQLS